MIRRMWRDLEDMPRALILGSLLCTVLSVVVVLVGIGRHGGYNVAAALLTVAAAVFTSRAWVLSLRRTLSPMQRVRLVEELSRLPPVDVRVAAVAKAEAVQYARQLLEVLRDASWPAHGVYRRDTGVEERGVFLAVNDGQHAPAHAHTLLQALRGVGVMALESVNAELAEPQQVELLVGRRH